ncbi:MAG: hypothetical protein CL916_01230 [Deltaproteobacteria bacterium]|nr:hypothetical protein [Deltaproteobacteria bacterium]
MSNKKLLILGATGSCGRHFVNHALNAGYAVRCLVRDPSRVTLDRFTWANHEQVELIAAQSDDRHIITEACQDVSAVICMIGPLPGANASPLGSAVRNIAEGMRKFRVNRFIVQAGGFTKIVGRPSLAEKLMRKVFIWFTNEAAMIEGNDEMAEFLVKECSDLQWTITRPGMLDEREESGIIEADHDYGPGMPGGKVGKIDLTRWYIDLLDDERSYQQAPAPRYQKS